MQASQASGLRLVSASAGSGKTYRLTQSVVGAVAPTDGAPIELEGLIGVTYTTKAQAELEARIRHALVEAGAFERAQQLPLAYLGTVHSVCLRLLKEFAIDAGLSPAVDVIPGNEGRRLLQAALERELSPELRSRIQELAFSLQLEWDGRVSRNDWVTPVEDIMTLARGNRIKPEALSHMAERSVQGLMALMPPSVPDGLALELALSSALERAIPAIKAIEDGQKNTAEALKQLRMAAADLATGRLTWSSWAKLAKVTPGKQGVKFVTEVRVAAAAYEVHPLFQQQIRELTELLFEAARVGLIAYANWKARRGLVDYVDMIDRALDVIASEDVARELRDRFSLLVVDEFQDTSPIQLALFMKLHGLCGRSVWVGDQKQCIFEYAGADPQLMDAVTRWATASGGKREFLTKNYRSRPELVQATSLLFAAAFAAHGFSAEEVVTSAHRDPSEELAGLPPCGLWWLKGQEQTALAEGVARLLAMPDATPVLDRVTKQARPVRPGDVAVLVYSNLDAGKLAAALKAKGIATVLPRVGLLRTPEGTLVSAALSVLVDSRDTLAAAELDALTGFHDLTENEWLGERIRARRLERASEMQPGDGTAVSSIPVAPRAAPVVLRLEELRPELATLSPAEALDRVLSVLDVPALAVRWPDPAQRLANLDALRALANAYEERCSYQREAASLSGLLRYFEETQQLIRQRDEERATDEQHADASADAVVISTYHKAKGLEWPVVILGSLGRKRKREAFEVAPESDGAEFDAANPLGGRWIRYWPWPLGQQRDVPLAERVASSPIGRAVAERDGRERTRLLYVGFTRARDHLVLAVPLLKKGPSSAWLDELADQRGPLLNLPNPDSVDLALRIRGPGDESLTVPARIWSLEAPDEDIEIESSSTDSEDRFWFARSTSAADIPGYFIAPSRAATEALDLGSIRVANTTRFTDRMSFTSTRGTDWDHVGTTLHAFLAADHPGLSSAARLNLAERILANADLDASFGASAIVDASNALRAFVKRRWPDAIWHREVPIQAMLDTKHGARRISGSIDLLLETAAGFVIIDHKSFPGRADQWAMKALEYAPQLLTYAKAVEMAQRPVVGLFVHFTIGGGIAELVRDAR
ncbi:MAG TPA: UvrD-helicase domain-containing protein [Polyangiaceae bacterium]|nr:UvrD-helicase domain-containing protein [Polyangiaceae bacterium]